MIFHFLCEWEWNRYPPSPYKILWRYWGSCCEYCTSKASTKYHTGIILVLVVVAREPIEWLTVLIVSSRNNASHLIFRHHDHQGLHELDGGFLEWMAERISISCDIMFLFAGLIWRLWS
jgi:hypothetical protein